MSELRLAVPADIPELEALIPTSVRGLSTGVYTRAQIDAALVHMFGVDSQIVADGTYYVIDHEKTVVAAGGWSARGKVFGGDQFKSDADPIVDPASTPARIRAFFVHPDWARRGLARQIFEKCEAAARARGFSSFELVATLPGVPLYEALGFTPVEPVSVALSGNLVLPCLRMHRFIGHNAR